MEKHTPLRKVTQLAWRRLLLSEHGVEGLLVLRENAPAVTVGEEHNIIFKAGVAEGWKLCLEAMHTLIAVEQTKREDVENP